MSLYPDQLLAAKEFEHWLNDTPLQTCGLWASAGFGKSYSMKHMIDEVVLKDSNYIPVICSMTHSAVEVLSEFVGRDVSTLHSTMGWIPYVDKESGEEGLSTPRMRDRNAGPRLMNNHLLIVDEAGLMGHDELRLLLEELSLTGARVLFVGDHKQCYPVIKEGQELCIPAYNYSEAKFELTEPKRTTEGDMIYKLALAYRASVDGADQPKLQTALNPDKKTGVRVVDDLEDIAVPAFKAGIRDGDVRKIKCLTFTNKRALTLNRKIRKRVMGIKSPIPTVGEEMVANTSISESAGENILIRNNEKLIVKQVEATTSHGLEGAFIQFEYAMPKIIDGIPTICEVPEIVFVPATPAKLLDRMKKLSNDAKAFKANGFDEESRQAWRAFFSLKEDCADIRFTYAMTINKAQGVTLKHALVDMNDISICQDNGQMSRCAYTAVTRATHYVTIEGELDQNVYFGGGCI